MKTVRILATLAATLALGANGAAFAQSGGGSGGNGGGNGAGGAGNAHGAATAGPTSGGDPISGPNAPKPRPKKVMRHKPASPGMNGGGASSQPSSGG